MTKLLAKAFEKASQLSEEEQDSIAVAVLADIVTSESEWDKRFAQSQDALERLADDALAAHRRGQSRPLDPDQL